MLDYFLLVIGCVIMAWIIQRKAIAYESVASCKKHVLSVRLLYWIILILLILFAGLRTHYNDTSTYWQLYQTAEMELNWAELFEPYGGYTITMVALKKFVSTNPQVYIFVTSAVYNFLYLRFIARHSKSFGASVYWYLIGQYMFGMAGIRQAMAIAIALYAIEAFLRKKTIKALIILLISSTFHPYIVVFVCLLLLKDNIWGSKTVLIIIVAFVLFLNLELVFKVFAMIGKDYSEEDLMSGMINPFRVAVCALPVLLSFLFRSKINETHDPWLILGCNMSILSFLFIFIALFVDPIYPGRMATYFDCISMLTTPRLLQVVFTEKNKRLFFVQGYYVLFTLYFLLDLTKLGKIPLMYDRFGHASLISLFIK